MKPESRRPEEGVPAPVRQLIAAHDGGDSRCGFELRRNAVAGGAAIEMGALEQRRELACGMPGQQHEYSSAHRPARRTSCAPHPAADVPSVLRTVNAVRRRRSSMAMVVSSGFSRARLACPVSSVNLAGQPREILPAIHRRKARARRDAEGRSVGGVSPLKASQHLPAALRRGRSPQGKPDQGQHRHAGAAYSPMPAAATEARGMQTPLQRSRARPAPRRKHRLSPRSERRVHSKGSGRSPPAERCASREVEADEEAHSEQCRDRIDVARRDRQREQQQKGKEAATAKRQRVPCASCRRTRSRARQAARAASAVQGRQIDGKLEEVLAGRVAMPGAVVIRRRRRKLREASGEVVPEEDAQRLGAVRACEPRPGSRGR